MDLEYLDSPEHHKAQVQFLSAHAGRESARALTALENQNYVAAAALFRVIAANYKQAAEHVDKLREIANA